MDRLAHTLRSISGTLLRRNGRGSPASFTALAADGAQPPVHPGWRQLPRAWGEAAELAHRNPEATAYIRYRAAQAGRAPEPHLTGWVPIDDISPYTVCALLSAEDPTFFLHRGILWAGIRKAIRKARREKKPVTAVSTITQQLARNLFLYPERSMKRKLLEAILARRLEQVLTKERILEIYLNVVEWGEGIWGIGSAAREHFSRTPAELDAFQSVVLVSMLPAPRRPLRDWNAKRAASNQMYTAVGLYGRGIRSIEETHELRTRIRELKRAIDDGVPAEEVLRASTQRPLALTTEGRPEISTRKLIASDGGIRLWEKLKPVLDEASRQKKPPPPLPLWWTGDPVPEKAEQVAG